MKTLFNNRILLVISMSVIFLNTSFSQIGLHYETIKSNAGTGFDMSKGTSAKGQLENITGQKISTSNEKNQYYNQPKKSIIKTPTLSYNQQAQVMVAGVLVQALLSNLFANNQADVEAQKQAAAIAAQKAEEQKKMEEALAQAKHDKMLESYKTLDGSQGLELKTLGNTNLGFKTLDDENANQQVHKNLFGSSNAVLDKTSFSSNSIDFNNPAWVEKQQQLFNERIEKPNKWANGAYNSLKTNAPPLPFKKFNELEPGDVLLFDPKAGDLTGAAVADVSNFGQNSQKSSASHTVTYLKEENGKKIFMDNLPGEGPKIINEDELRTIYLERNASVAKLVGQPLNTNQANILYQTAKEMELKNIEKSGSGNYWDSTNYGAIGNDNMLCSETSWALIKSTGRALPLSKSWVSKSTGVNFSPADFYENTQYFFVTPLSLDK